MLPIKKIVCPLDLSDLSPRVAEYAVAMARAFGSEVLVVYVAPSVNQYAVLDVPPQSLEWFTEEISTNAVNHMGKVTTELFTGIKVETKILSGNPAEEIIKVARENNADLIVMGTRGRKGVDLLVFGTVADKVVKNSKIPVLTVHPAESQEPPVVAPFSV